MSDKTWSYAHSLLRCISQKLLFTILQYYLGGSEFDFKSKKIEKVLISLSSLIIKNLQKVEINSDTYAFYTNLLTGLFCEFKVLN